MWGLWKQNKGNMTRKVSVPVKTEAAYFWIDYVINRTDRLALVAR